MPNHQGHPVDFEVFTHFRPGDGDEAPKPKLFTPLHQAAHGRAPRAVVRKLLELGAQRSLKTQGGKTAYDIAKAITVPREEVLDLLKVPAEVTDNQGGDSIMGHHWQVTLPPDGEAKFCIRNISHCSWIEYSL